jgi:hypothetical protein
MNMERYWNDRNRGNPSKQEKILSQCHSTRHKPRMDWHGIERRPLR